MKKTIKQILFSVVCVMALATFASCNKDGNETGSGTPSGGNITPAVYVDLGLPSGTKWKSVNETNPNDKNDLYIYNDAMATFGNKLPTIEQFEELKDLCEWIWIETGYKVVGTNGNYIILPAAGDRSCGGYLRWSGSSGFYWSSTPLYRSEFAWYLEFRSDIDTVFIQNTANLCYGHSVRLVQD